MSEENESVQKKDPSESIAALMTQVVLDGNLANISSAERLRWYDRVCKSLKLNPLTKPFEFVSMKGKVVAYATKNCCEQLRNNYQVSIQLIEKEFFDDGKFYRVTARAINGVGRQDESTAVVTLEGLKGDDKANAIMKCETKAKRRVTLSICGLGMLDELELETIKESQRVKYNSETGELEKYKRTSYKDTSLPENQITPEQRDELETLQANPNLLPHHKENIGRFLLDEKSNRRDAGRMIEFMTNEIEATINLESDADNN